jgi:hypothetical protein
VHLLLGCTKGVVYRAGCNGGVPGKVYRGCNRRCLGCNRGVPKGVDVHLLLGCTKGVILCRV